MLQHFFLLKTRRNGHISSFPMVGHKNRILLHLNTHIHLYIILYRISHKGHQNTLILTQKETCVTNSNKTSRTPSPHPHFHQTTHAYIYNKHTYITIKVTYFVSVFFINDAMMIIILIFVFCKWKYKYKYVQMKGTGQKNNLLHAVYK